MRPSANAFGWSVAFCPFCLWTITVDAGEDHRSDVEALVEEHLSDHVEEMMEAAYG